MKPMIAVQLKTPAHGELPEEVEIVVDSAGLDSLLAQLSFLKRGQTEHVHLMSESWGGSHLEDSSLRPDATSIKHLKVLLR
jgi:hypothetical protein